MVSKTKEGRDYFRDEKTEWNNVFRFGLDRAALGSLPEDPERFPPVDFRAGRSPQWNQDAAVGGS